MAGYSPRQTGMKVWRRIACRRGANPAPETNQSKQSCCAWINRGWTPMSQSLNKTRNLAVGTHRVHGMITNIWFWFTLAGWIRKTDDEPESPLIGHHSAKLRRNCLQCLVPALSIFWPSDCMQEAILRYFVYLKIFLSICVPKSSSTLSAAHQAQHIMDLICKRQNQTVSHKTPLTDRNEYSTMIMAWFHEWFHFSKEHFLYTKCLSPGHQDHNLEKMQFWYVCRWWCMPLNIFEVDVEWHWD
jgi:hypothetical protein